MPFSRSRVNRASTGARYQIQPESTLRSTIKAVFKAVFKLAPIEQFFCLFLYIYIYILIHIYTYKFFILLIRKYFEQLGSFLIIYNYFLNKPKIKLMKLIWRIGRKHELNRNLRHTGRMREKKEKE